MKYIGNAFSLGMVPREFLGHVRLSPCAAPDVSGLVSCVGHADTAAVLGVEMRRVSVTLYPGDMLYVAQLMGSRLPEGTTTLPEGFRFEWIKVEVASSQFACPFTREVAPPAAPAWAADAETARQYAWVAAAIAKLAGLRYETQACIAQAQELETVHSPHGKLLTAIFSGGCPVAGYEALALRGKKMGVTPEIAAEAKAFVNG